LLKNREKGGQSSACFRGFGSAAGQKQAGNRNLTLIPLQPKPLDILALPPTVKSHGKIEKICSMEMQVRTSGTFNTSAKPVSFRQLI